MKVLQLIQRSQRRGAEIFAVDLSRSLDRMGHVSRVVSLYRHSGEALALSSSDVALDGDEKRRSEIVFDPLLLARVMAQVKDFGPDVVQANGGRSVKYAALARLCGADAGFWVYRNIGSPNFWLNNKVSSRLFPWLVERGFDAAVGVSESTLTEVHQTYGFAGASEAIPNGVDFDRFRVLPQEQSILAVGKPRIVWVGALDKLKRPELAIEVLARLTNPDISLTFFGEGPACDVVEKASVAAGLKGRVLIAGSHARIAASLRDADLFLMTSATEGIPASVIEAQHCGLPVVAFDVGGLRECVVHGSSGLLVPDCDLDQMVAAVNGILEDPDRRRQMSIEAVKNAERFGIDQIALRYADFYRRRGAPRRRTSDG